MTDAETIHSRVEYDTNGGCWLWPGTTTRDGYGNLRGVSVHRVAYQTFVGPIPPRMCVCHRCDVPNCVNPAHLWLGTHADNMRDRIAKGRYVKKLTWESVDRMRAAFANSDPTEENRSTIARLATEFGVSASTAESIISGKRWREHRRPSPPNPHP